MTSDSTLLAMISRISLFREFDGCVVGFQGDGECRVLVKARPVSSTYRCVAIVIELVEDDDPAGLRELQSVAKAPPGATRATDYVSNRSRVGSEMAGGGISCGLTIVSALGMIAGVAGEIPTGGASSFLVVAAWTGITMGGLQCLNGLVRVGAAFAALDDNSLQRWDSTLTYSSASLLVDAIGVASGIATLPAAARNLFAVLSRQRVFMAKGLSLASLRGMNRVERLHALSEVFEDAAKTPEGRKALVEAARSAGIGSKTLQRGSGISVRHAEALRRVISDETVKRLSASLRDVLTGTAVVGASATPASLTGSASGSVNYVIHLLDAGVVRSTK